MAPDNRSIEKHNLLLTLVDVRKQIIDRSRQIDPALVRTPFLGHWSIMELLAHLSGWDLANLEAAEAILAGRLPAFYEHYDKDWRAFNRLLIQRYLVSDFKSMLAAVADSHQQLIAALEPIPAADFFKDNGLRFKGYKVIIGRLLAAEVEDEGEHFKQIDSFIGDCIGSDCDGSVPSV